MIKHLEEFKNLIIQSAEIRLFDGVGAEKFADHAWKFADNLIKDATDDVVGVSVECMEHGANSAI